MKHQHAVTLFGMMLVWVASWFALAPSFALALEGVDAVGVRQQVMLSAEPAGAMTPTAARQLLLKAAANEPQPLVLAGRLGAKGMEPFLENKASFVLVESPADDHAKKAGHDADNCPFCKKRQANAPMVAVQFLGADGKVIPIDSRQLFGIAKGNEVVVKGTAVFDPKLALPIVQFTADGIFVRGQ